MTQLLMVGRMKVDQANCTSCGSPIPEGQGSSCSMCYGDPNYGSDGYYQAFLDQQYEDEMAQQYREDNREREE